MWSLIDQKVINAGMTIEWCESSPGRVIWREHCSVSQVCWSLRQPGKRFPQQSPDNPCGMVGVAQGKGMTGCAFPHQLLEPKHL